MKRLILLLPILLLIFSCTESERNEAAMADMNNLRIKHDSLINVLNERRHCVNYWYDIEFDGIELIEKGINNPVEFIESSLREKPELIPTITGSEGKMRFDNIQILGKEWLIADFDDGKIQGRAIYQYKLNDENELEFKIVNINGSR